MHHLDLALDWSKKSQRINIKVSFFHCIIVGNLANTFTAFNCYSSLRPLEMDFCIGYMYSIYFEYKYSTSITNNHNNIYSFFGTKSTSD